MTTVPRKRFALSFVVDTMTMPTHAVTAEPFMVGEKTIGTRMQFAALGEDEFFRLLYTVKVHCEKALRELQEKGRVRTE